MSGYGLVSADRDSKGRVLCEFCFVGNGDTVLARWKFHIKDKDDGTDEYVAKCEDHAEDLEDDDRYEILAKYEMNNDD